MSENIKRICKNTQRESIIFNEEYSSYILNLLRKPMK